MTRLKEMLPGVKEEDAYSLDDLPEQEYEIISYSFFRVVGYTYVYVMAEGEDGAYYRIVDCHPEFRTALKVACAAKLTRLTFRPSEFLAEDGKEA